MSRRVLPSTSLCLNDALVDLDKEVSIVVNGKQILLSKVHRSMSILRKEMKKRFDPTFVYPAYLRFSVPKEEKKKADGETEDDKKAEK